jgi:predicted RNase H-like HicB family nuclease
MPAQTTISYAVLINQVGREKVLNHGGQLARGFRRQEGLCLLRLRMVFFARMLTEYLNAAMAKAHYELLDGGEGFYGEIPGFQGVLAQADTLEACRSELADTLEDWLLFRISRQLPVPVVEGLDLTVKESSAFA